MSDEKECKPLMSSQLLDSISIDTMAIIARDLFKHDNDRYTLLSGLTYMEPEVVRERLSWLTVVEGEGGS